MVDLLPSDVKGLDPVQEREDDNEEILNTEVSINGAKVKVGDMFPDIFEARNFLRQVQLIDAARKAPKKDSSGEEIDTID